MPLDSGPPTRLLVALLLGAVAAVLLGGCTAASDSDAADAGAPLAALEWRPCELQGSRGQGRVAAQCTRMDVPENPQRPTARRIELFVARIAALSPNPAADAFTLVNGGPGASSVSMYVDLEPAFAGILRDRDIVVMDQRGTGRSAALDCPGLEEASNQLDPAAVREPARRCLETLAANGVDPRFYTTSVAVEDLELLRRSLGYSRWNLYGVSYGTRVAQHYLQRFPDAVRTLILDGVVPPPLALGPDIAVNAQHTLDTILARCRGEPSCDRAFPDLANTFEKLSTRLKSAPVELEIPHPLTGQLQAFALAYGHLAMTVRLLSYAPETAALIPLIIEQAAAGNYLPVAAQALRIEGELSDAISFGMHNSVVCTEDAPFYGDLETMLPAMEASYLGADQVRSLQAICEIWPAGVIDSRLKETLASDAPVLLLSGENDPITPPDYAERTAAGLTNSLLVVAPGQGHGVLGRGCIPYLISDFVAAGSLEGLDTSCVARLAGDSFFVNLMGPPP